jgi:quercetin dioxygenase-like cupin family protein
VENAQCVDPVVVAPEDRPQALSLVGEQVTVFVDGATTGNFEIFHQAGPEGSGPVPHNHPWHEAFYVTAGQVTFAIGDTGDQVATAGTFVFIPAGSTHWFRFGPVGGEMLSMTPRPGVAEFFADVDRQVSPTEPDFATLERIATSHGLTVLAPAS